MHDIWNPWHGCTKCSPGCEHCYMYFLDEQRGVQRPSSEVFRTRNFNYPLSKNRQKQYKIKSGERIRVNMTSDTFLEAADEWRDEMWDIIRQRPDVVFWFITKRPERILDHLPSDWGDGWENCVMNVTCENQDMFTKRYQYLIDLPAKHKGLCLAPLISDIDISPILEQIHIDNVSAGGENYADPRPCKYEWVEHIAETCRKYKTNFVWFETGTNFWMNDKHYFIPNKQKQSTEAWFAGLNQHYYDVVYKLTDLEGNPVFEDTVYEKVYNLNSCLFCSNQDLCNGCSKCGNCGGNERIVSRSELQRLQNMRSGISTHEETVNKVSTWDGYFSLDAYLSGY